MLLYIAMKIFNADCLEQLPKLEKKSIDLVVVDLPYGQTACKWDSVIDLKKMWKELTRLSKDDCTYAFFCTTKFGNTLINSRPMWFKYDLVWEKNHALGFLSAKKIPLRKHEMIYIFKSKNTNDKNIELNLKMREYSKKVFKYIGKTRSEIKKEFKKDCTSHFFAHTTSQFGLPTKKTYDKLTELYSLEKMDGYLKWDEFPKFERVSSKTIYNPQMTKGKPYKIKKGTLPDCVYGNQTRSTINNKGTRYPVSILKFGYDKEKLHPTQKPVKLCEWLVKTYSNEGDTVLDFTMGSGSTGVACQNTKREFIGIEKDKEIFEVAKKRLI